MYKLYAAKIGSTVIPVMGTSIDPKIEKWINGDASTFDPTAVSVQQMIPVCTFDTEAILAVLAVVNVAPVRITTGNALVLYYAKCADGAAWSSSADSMSITVNEGVMTLEQASGDATKAATVSVSVTAVHDGTNFPLTKALVTIGSVTVTPIANHYGLFGVVYNNSGVNTFIPTESATVTIGHQINAARHAGSEFASTCHVQHTSSGANFQSKALKTVIDLLGISGLSLSSLDSTDLTDGTSLEVYFGKKDKGGRFASGSNHIVFKIYNGVVFMDQISAENNNDATVDVQAQAISGYDADEGVYIAPTGYSAGVALPTVSALSATWTLGPVVANSVEWMTTSTSVKLGYNTERGGWDGHSSDNYVILKDRAPEVTISCYELLKSLVGIVDATPTPGKQLTNVVFYFRKNAAGSTRVASATGEHISVTLYDCYAEPQAQNVNAREIAKGGVVFSGIRSGGNAAISIDTTAEIA